MKNKFGLEMITKVILVHILFLSFAYQCWAVNSKVTRHASSVDLLKGQNKDTVISSKGTIQLGLAAEVLVDKFEDTWSINSIIVSGGTIYIGTSPNGNIYKYSLGKLTKIYPQGQDLTGHIDHKKESEFENLPTNDVPDSNDANQINNAQEVQAEKYLSNEHIFAMAIDVAGRLLAGISGDKCRLCRYEAGKFETIFEPNDAKYIFSIAIDDKGDIYLGTGPEGKVYKLDSLGKKAEILYTSRDKNILSLAIGQDDFIYAGSDDRGLIYKINIRTQKTTVLYDSDQPEITALLFLSDKSFQQLDLYAAATSAEIAQVEAVFPKQVPSSGRPEVTTESPDTTDNSERKLQIANTKEQTDEKSVKRKLPVRKITKPEKASYIYKITKDGFVTDVFSEVAVFFCLTEQNNELLLGTGNNAQLFNINPAKERQAIVYEDEQASQITAVTVTGQDVYLGTSNPAKLVKLSQILATEGTYISDLIDAGQPAKWGKLQIEADIPQNCRILVASRSGNVKDANDPTFSDWTDLVEVTKPIQLQCPLGRFCQYKLVLQSDDGKQSPIIREIAVASTVPNLAPKVESVEVERIQAPSKTGLFKISLKAKDDNDDKLIYKIDFRKIGRENWIELKDELEADNFEWDGKTVEDGRYEVRVTASDEISNTTTTKLTGSRISEPVVIDNTGPVINKYTIEPGNKTVTVKLQVSDQLSAIGQLHYTIDSNEQWKGTLPDDLVYDTTDENFTIAIEDLEPGEHIISIRVADDIGNTTYKTFEVNLTNK